MPPTTQACLVPADEALARLRGNGLASGEPMGDLARKVPGIAAATPVRRRRGTLAGHASRKSTDGRDPRFGRAPLHLIVVGVRGWREGVSCGDVL